MASGNVPKKPPELKQDPLIDKLAPEPGDAGPLTTLSGFVGKSPREGKWRLYTSPRLDEHFEFDASDVQHVEALNPAESALGGSRVWLRSGALVRHTKVSSRDVQAEFLQGGIASAHMAGAALGNRALGQRPAGRCLTVGHACAAKANSVDLCVSDPLGNTYNQHIPMCRSDGMGHCGFPSIDGTCATNDGGPLCGNTGDFVCGPSQGCTGGVECGVT